MGPAEYARAIRGLSQERGTAAVAVTYPETVHSFANEDIQHDHCIRVGGARTKLRAGSSLRMPG
jgi:hypothetical protein